MYKASKEDKLFAISISKVSTLNKLAMSRILERVSGVSKVVEAFQIESVEIVGQVFNHQIFEILKPRAFICVDTFFDGVPIDQCVGEMSAKLRVFY